MGLVNLNRIHHVRLNYKKILPAIVVEVHKTHAPARMQKADRSQAAGHSGIIKRSVSGIGVECILLIGQIGDNHVRPSVVVVILEIDAHSGERGATAGQSKAGSDSDFLESSVSLVVKEKFRNRIIGQ